MGTIVSIISLKSNCHYKLQEPPQVDFLVSKCGLWSQITCVVLQHEKA